MSDTTRSRQPKAFPLVSRSTRLGACWLPAADHAAGGTVPVLTGAKEP